MSDYDYIFKAIVIGQSGVGKTTLIKRYVHNMFTADHYTTIGVDFQIKEIEVKGKCVKLQLWDTAGQERFHSIAVSYFRGANAFMLVFALDDLRSYERLPYWMNQVEEHKVSYSILVGNKCDVENPVVTEEMVQAFLKTYPHMVYIRASAKTGQSVEEAFRNIVEALVSKESIKADKSLVKLMLQEPGEIKREGSGGGCCGGTG
jgi:small GTP-binding protein